MARWDALLHTACDRHFYVMSSKIKFRIIYCFTVDIKALLKWYI